MARKGREKSATGVYALMLRGNRQLFVSDDDYSVFVELMEKYFNGRCILYAYSLSKSAVNLLIKENDEGISADIKPIVTSYARYYNRTHGFEGKLFKDRFKSEPCESDSEINDNIAFIHNINKYMGEFAVTSSDAYTNGGICGIKKDESILNMPVGRLCLYDYSLMEDKALISLLSDIKGENIAGLSYDELREFIKEQKYISLSRVIRGLDDRVYQKPVSAPKKKEKTEQKEIKTEKILKKPPEENEPTQKNEEKKKNSLPPWLL